MELSYEAKKNAPSSPSVFYCLHIVTDLSMGVDECDTSRAQYGKSRRLFIIYFENSSLNKI